MTGNKPVLTLRSHGLSAAAWQNKGKDDRTYYSVKLQRRYFDKDSQSWKDSAYLSSQDLLPAAKLLEELWSMLEVKDKGEDGGDQDLVQGVEVRC